MPTVRDPGRHCLFREEWNELRKCISGQLDSFHEPGSLCLAAFSLGIKGGKGINCSLFLGRFFTQPRTRSLRFPS